MRSGSANTKKGIHGISVLFFFLAVLLISVGIAAVLLTTTDKLVGDATKQYNHVSGNYKAINVIEVAGLDARDEDLELITVDISLVDHSAPMHFSDLTLSLGEPDAQTFLRYREGGEAVNNNSGYNTWSPQEFGQLAYSEGVLDLTMDIISAVGTYTLPLDLDGDGLATDTVIICDVANGCPAPYDGKYLVFDLSGTPDVHYAPLLNQNGTLADVNAGTTLDVVRSPIDGGYGYITLQGATVFPNEIDSGVDVTLYLRGEQLEEDLDDDGLNDYFSLNATYVIIYLSSLYPDGIDVPLGVDLSAAPVALNINEQIITPDGDYLGRITIQGTTQTPDEIDEDVDFTITPYRLGEGYYVAEYLRRGSSPQDGFIVPGDLVRFYAQTYRDLVVDEIFTIQFIYHNLESVPKQVYTFNTMPYAERFVLFPRP